MVRLFALVALALFAGLAPAKNLYVNNSGSPACSDSTTYAANDAANPWCTIGRAAWGNASPTSVTAAQAAAAGDVVLITAGTYTTTSANSTSCSGVRFNAALNPANSGTSGNLITFRGVGTVNIYLASGYYGPTIGADSRNYIAWDTVVINETAAGVESCADTGPVVLHATIGSKILNSEIRGRTTAWGDNYNGIRLEAATSCTVSGNTIHDFYGNFGHNTSGIMFYDTESCIIEHNYIYNIQNGIYVKGDHTGDGYPQQNNTIRFNWIEEIGSECIYLYTAAGTQVYQNITKNCNLHIKKLGDAVNNGIYIVNNTHVTTNSTEAAFSTEGDPTTHTTLFWHNNICAGTFSECINLGGQCATGQPIGNQDFEHNVYYNYVGFGSTGNTANCGTTPTGAATVTLANWKATYSKDSVSPAAITSNPSFVTTSYPGGYKLNVGSPALTQGIDILDLNGNSSVTDTIPAGAYITGSETIGPGGSGLLSAPGNVRFRPRTSWAYFLMLAGAH